MVWLPRWGCDGMIGSAQKLLMARAGVPSGPPPDWDFSSFAYTGNSYTASQQALPNGLYFKSDGTTFIICGLGGDTAYQYDLSTAWDISTASYSGKSFYHGAAANAQDIYVEADGSAFYLVDFNSTSGVVYKYPMTTAWDVSSASYLTVSSYDTSRGSRRGLSFSDDGVYMFVSGNGAAYRYTLSTPWDVTTAGSELAAPSACNDLQAISLSPNGTSLAGSKTDGNVYLFKMSVGFDISKLSLVSTHSVGTQVSQPYGLFVSADGSNIYTHEFFAPIYQYSA